MPVPAIISNKTEIQLTHDGSVTFRNRCAIAGYTWIGFSSVNKHAIIDTAGLLMATIEGEYLDTSAGAWTVVFDILNHDLRNIIAETVSNEGTA